MFERLLRMERPSHLVACFDGPRATFRREIFPEYKANRDEPDEELRVQFPLVRRLVDAMDIPAVQVDGFEADDILATLAQRFAADGIEVVIVTGDKDLMQCVGDHVSLYDPMKNKWVRRPQVIEKFGVGPEGVAHVLGLMGDSSDNIPGVRGVGPKTATALIAHFGDVESMLARPEEIEGLPIRGAKSARKKIEEGAEQARLSLELATVREDVPIKLTFAATEVTSFVTPELEKLAEELEMDRLVSRMYTLGNERGLEGGSSTPVRRQAEPVGQISSAKPKPAASRAKKSSKPEESGTLALPMREVLQAKGDWKELAGRTVAIAVADLQDGQGLIIGDSSTVILVGASQIGDVVLGLADAGCSFVGCDLKGLVRDFGAWGGEASLDLGLAAYLCDTEAGDHRLEDLCSRYAAHELIDPTASFDGPAQLISQVLEVAQVLRAELVARDQDDLYRTLEHPLMRILGCVEAVGICVDVATLNEMSTELGARMEAAVEGIYAAAGRSFNILSPLQLRQILYEELGLPTKGIKKTKTGPSTDSDSLEALASQHPLPTLVLEYRGLAKLKSTYVDALPRLVDEGGRIHTRLNQTVTATGRLSSSDPNLQNIPVRTPDGARIRAAFIAPPGKRLVSADYNQIELRVLAHLSGDEALCEAFRSGVDIHVATYADLFELDPATVDAAKRREAKVVNYGIVYGMGAVRLSRELGVSRARASEYIERYFERYSGVRRFYDQMLDQARSGGFVGTIMGRRRYLPDINSDHGGRRQAAERIATNTPIQGSAADLIKKAMVLMAGALETEKLKSQLILQIHDELLLECPVEEVETVSRLVTEVMEGAVALSVPVVVDVGSGLNWIEAH
jgi:DNA polymerase-1